MENKKIIFITGATRGIGKNMALYFAREGYIVVGSGRNEEKLNEVREEILKISGDHRMITMDVTNEQDIKDAVKYTIDAFGKIDVWVNNAGSFQAIGPTWEVNTEDFKTDLTTNIIGTFNCTHHVIPVMLQQAFGKIINIVGGGTVGTFKYGNGYGVSKTAIARFTENLSAELEETNVETYALDPGLNDTDMTRYQRESKVGQSYLAGIEKLFEDKIDVGPDVAPAWVLNMAEGKVQEYKGRIISVYDQLEELKEFAKNTTEEDYYQLRLKK